jgi:hypothetical protein
MIFRHPCFATILKTTRGGAYGLAALTVVDELPSRWPQVSVLQPRNFMCDDSGCPTDLNGEFLFRDLTHIRRNLTAATTEQFVQLLHLPEAINRAASGR